MLLNAMEIIIANIKAPADSLKVSWNNPYNNIPTKAQNKPVNLLLLK